MQTDIKQLQEEILTKDNKKLQEDEDYDGGAGPPAKRAKSGTVLKGMRRKVPGGDENMSEEAVADLLPGAAKVYKVDNEHRWRVQYDECRLSRSWLLRPPRDAILEVVRFAWDKHFLCTGEKCTVSGVYNR